MRDLCFFDKFVPEADVGLATVVVAAESPLCARIANVPHAP